jgi:hypothetical protein
VAHVELAAGVGQHLEAVELGARRGVGFGGVEEKFFAAFDDFVGTHVADHLFFVFALGDGDGFKA